MFLRTTSVLIANSRGIKRWVAPTLRELRRRKEKMDKSIIPPAPHSRSSFLEWNYKSELFACGKRLNENFNMDLLQQAFLHKSYVLNDVEKRKEIGIYDSNTKMEDNRSLIDKGVAVMKSYISTFVSNSFPNMPVEGQKSIQDYLLSTELLANISKNLGMKDLLLSLDKDNKEILADTLKAVIGALVKSSGNDRAKLFIRDFICVQLNQKEINEIWTITNPLKLLQDICKEKKLGEPEPRLIGDAGKNTLVCVYNVGIYCNKKLIGNGFGENIDIAIESAARDSLSEIFDIKLSMKPLDFKTEILH